MILGQPEPSCVSSYFFSLRFLFEQNIVFEELYYGVHPTEAHFDLMDTNRVFRNLVYSAQMLDENNSREPSCREGSKRGQ